MTRRHEYLLDLTVFHGGSTLDSALGLERRAADRSDLSALAALMIESYRGTIDYDGETLSDAIAEVRAYLEGERGGEPLLNVSRLAFAGGRLIAACLAAIWNEKQAPLIAYVMTDGGWKRRGIARQLLGDVLSALRQEGHREVRAVITEGNLSSEKLFARMGFRRVA